MECSSDVYRKSPSILAMAGKGSSRCPLAGGGCFFSSL